MKKIKLFISILSVALLFFNLKGYGQQPHPEAPALIRKALEYALTSDNKVPDYNLLKNKKKVVVSRAVVNKFISEIADFHYDLYPPENFPEKVGETKILPLSKPEIQIRADRKKDYLYLQIGNIKIEGDRAEIGVSTNWAVSRKTKGRVYMSGGGYILEFVKVNGQWQFSRERTRWQS